MLRWTFQGEKHEQFMYIVFYLMLALTSGSKPVGGSKVDSVLYRCKVDQLSTSSVALR